MKKQSKDKHGIVKNDKWKKYSFRGVVAALLGFISSASYDYVSVGDCHISLLFFIRAAILFGLYLSLFCLMEFVLSKGRKLDKVLNNKATKYLLGSKTPFLRQILIIAGILIALWIPYLIASYPGNMSNDTTGQLPMYFSMIDGEGEYIMQDQHPVFTTLVFGSIVYLGNSIFGNMQVALFICIFLQMVVTALTFSFAIVWARRKWSIPIWLCLCVIVFLTLLPVVPMMVISLSKDTFFSWIYVLFLIALFELVRQDFRLIDNKKYLLVLTVLCLGICLTKKLGIYIVSGTLLIFIIFCGRQLRVRLKMAVPLLLSVCLMFIIMPLIIANTKIASTPTKEMFGLPFQQTALTYIRHGNEMTNEELEQLDNLMHLSDLKERYDPAIVDPVKAPVENDSDFNAYLKLYMRQLFKYPDSYIDAFACQAAGLFVPSKIDLIFDNHWHTWNNGFFEEGFFEKPAFSAWQSMKMEQYYDWFASVPFLNLSVFSITYVVFIPAWFLVCLVEKRKKKRELLVFVPILASVVGLMLSATMYQGAEAMRYIMPFVYSAPVLLAYSRYLLSA